MKSGIVPWNQRIGDIGESEIEARLRRISTTTKIERDIGIDFYCELLIDNKPFSPFFVQAKSSKHWDGKKGRSIDKGTIVFWLSRPSPLYVLFYDEKDDICYWHSVEKDRYDLIGKIFLTASESVYISFSNDKIFDKGENNEFKLQLESDYQSLLSFRGMPQFGGSGYVKTVPPPPRSEYEYDRIKLNARASLYSLIRLHILNKETDDAINLAEAVAKFDQSHHTHFVWLGYLYKDKKEPVSAIENFRQAIDICTKDETLDPDMKDSWVSRFETEINELNNT